MKSPKDIQAMGLSELNKLLEEDVRQLRDRCFDRPTSDENWEVVKGNWMKPESIEWLFKNQKPIQV